jgi:hypothetical protein
MLFLTIVTWSVYIYEYTKTREEMYTFIEQICVIGSISKVFTKDCRFGIKSTFCRWDIFYIYFSIFWKNLKRLPFIFIHVFSNVENELKRIQKLKQITNKFLFFGIPILLNNNSDNYCDGYIFIVILDNNTWPTVRCGYVLRSYYSTHVSTADIAWNLKYLLVSRGRVRTSRETACCMRAAPRFNS